MFSFLWNFQNVKILLPIGLIFIFTGVVILIVSSNQEDPPKYVVQQGWDSQNFSGQIHKNFETSRCFTKRFLVVQLFMIHFSRHYQPLRISVIKRDLINNNRKILKA
jgi:hypothetical protein